MFCVYSCKRSRHYKLSNRDVNFEGGVEFKSLHNVTKSIQFFHVLCIIYQYYSHDHFTRVSINIYYQFAV